jgi:hypothetical protein
LDRLPATTRTRRRRGWLLLGLLLVTATLLGAARRSPSPLPRLVLRPPTESELRARFLTEHPGERPLNWAIAAAGERLHRDRAMGQFVLAVQPGQWGNDCSDFVACAVDEGLGVKARHDRGSREHIYGERGGLYEVMLWRPGIVPQPGDLVSVRHSPWYPPTDQAAGHVGLVGPDGDVLDFTKLRRWKQPRYGRNSFTWFVRHSPGPTEVTLWRLKPEYRYRAVPLPPVERS